MVSLCSCAERQLDRVKVGFCHPWQMYIMRQVLYSYHSHAAFITHSVCADIYLLVMVDETRDGRQAWGDDVPHRLQGHNQMHILFHLSV